MIKRLAQAILKRPDSDGEKRLVGLAFSTLLFDFDEIHNESQAIQFAAYAYDLRKKSLYTLADRLEELQNTLATTSNECSLEEPCFSIYSVQSGLQRRVVKLEHKENLVSMLLNLSEPSSSHRVPCAKSDLLGTTQFSRDPQLHVTDHEWDDLNSIGPTSVSVPPFALPDPFSFPPSMPGHLCLNQEEQALSSRLIDTPPSKSSRQTVRSLLFGGQAAAGACDDLDVFLALPLLPAAPESPGATCGAIWPPPIALRRVAAAAAGQAASAAAPVAPIRPTSQSPPSGAKGEALPWASGEPAGGIHEPARNLCAAAAAGPSPAKKLVPRCPTWEDTAPAGARRDHGREDAEQRRPVSERGPAAFDRAAGWAAGGGCASLGVPAEYGAAVCEAALVRDAVGLLLGLASRSFALDAGRGVLAPRDYGAAAAIRTPGRGRTALRSLLAELCEAGSHALRLQVRRERGWGRGGGIRKDGGERKGWL